MQTAVVIDYSGKDDGTRAVGQDEDAVLYQEYLWVFNRERISTTAFSELLANFTLHYAGVALKTLVEMFRVFLNSEAELDTEEDDLLAESCGHSSGTATQIYSVEHNTLPMLSSDIVLRHRTLCEKWHQVLGLRPGPL
ncbi:hypothetical protein B0H13DRAFT_1873247 [Mycena leptocephala]|nr:hypothetical protein B0H13DRAFT_1873247 [Mycena leptocephala]